MPTVTALTIAGTDPTGGAGIMADLKSFQARGVYGMAVITSVVAQNTCGVQAVEHLSLDILEAQLSSVFTDISPQVIKTGMLAQSDMIALVAKHLKRENKPYILDPVMVATSGDSLIDEKAIGSLSHTLLPLALLITPNLPEAEVLLGEKIVSETDLLKAGPKIQKEYGVSNVVIKGGHLAGQAKDYLFLKNGDVREFTGQRIATKQTHGTGCTYSAVIAAETAKGKSLIEAVATAKRFIQTAIETAPHLGHGNGPVNHISYKGD
ncbi:bifunctional hydroxymethylpyrimidine kinase/phosphomethylpyrimidine kinase [Streptococcus dentiloxodontae]